MNRIISLCFVALICVFSLAAPARASDLDNNSLINVLDYNTDKLAVIKFTSSSPTVKFDLPDKIPIRYVEGVLAYSGDEPVSFIYNGSSDVVLTLRPIGGNLYRFYCSAKGSFDNVSITVDTSGTTNVTFYQLKVASLPWTHYDTESYCQISAYDYLNTIHYVPTDEINYRIIDTTGIGEVSTAFALLVYSNEWKKYDYLDFEILCVCESITSVSAYIDDTLIPVEVNKIENNTAYENDVKDFRVYVRVDLSGIDRTTDSLPCVLISGQLGYQFANRIEVIGTSGYVVLGDYNVLFYYLRNILESLKQLSHSDTSSSTNFNNELDEELTQLDQAQAVMDSVTKPAIEDINVSVDQYVSQADIQVLAQPLAVIFDSAIFSKVIIMSILLATVSYTLYGKK